ncbi:hypothetical protein GURASL_13260 [Geotalea uraniireducens]|uniref:HTH cro/C1-type domain-containing protein n=1 Tax=Geotalea uraniireducens TaxID=351604 RepID=A0ABN6VQ55_9BACT|nr:helix-turn-helix transcriptional regulator [Geotalea uraniireducens]BDV42403.1 hypothetical protein GURASL_13260 [Geotalea uraniireducens]
MKRKTQLSRSKAAKIKSMLVARDITQQSIAEYLDISPAAVSGAINGHFNSRRTREYVAQLLNVDYHKLWGKSA